MTLRLEGSSSGYIELDAPAAAGSNTLTLPTSNGSANQYLKNGSTAGLLEFATLPASGKILNVVTTTNTDEFRGTNTTYSDLFTVAITPSATTSKILICATLSIGKANDHSCLARLVRKIGSGSYAAFGGGVGTETNHDDNTWWNIRNFLYNVSPYTVVYLDSPSTTDEVTYKAQVKTTNSGKAYAVNHTVQNGNNQYESPVMSTITVLEVGA